LTEYEWLSTSEDLLSMISLMQSSFQGRRDGHEDLLETSF
jgi:hypothetical protein